MAVFVCQMTEKFLKYAKLHPNIQGWFTLESAAVWDFLLDFQRLKYIRGSMMEIGVMHGKSAALMSLFFDADEGSMLLIDAYVDFERAKKTIQECRDGDDNEIYFLKMDSRELHATKFVEPGFRTYRWIHIDGEHTARGLESDLKLAAKLLSSQGILVIDDFFNFGYPQVTRALFQYLDRNPNDFSMLLTAYHKAYLVRPERLNFYREYCLENLKDGLNVRGLEVTIWKTNADTELTSLSITPKFFDRDIVGPDHDPEHIKLGY